MMLISIIIPCLNEEKYIEECIKSVLAFDKNGFDTEIIVVDGGSSDNTRTILNGYEEKGITLITHNEKTVPISLNMGIKKSKGDYIARLDAHSKYPKEYLTCLYQWSKRLDADNVGVHCKTVSKISDSKLQDSFCFTLNDIFGIGNSSFRLGVKEPTLVDTVPFGFFKRSVFDKFGYFDERLERNQDIEFNSRIRAHGGSVYLIPDLSLSYFVPHGVKDFSKKNYKNGYWNILTCYFLGGFRSLSLRHFVPLFFVLYLAILFISTPMLDNIMYKIILYIPFFVYLACLFLRSLLGCKNITSYFCRILSFLSLHIPYGIGSMKAIFDIWVKNVKK